VLSTRQKLDQGNRRKRRTYLALRVKFRSRIKQFFVSNLRPPFVSFLGVRNQKMLSLQTSGNGFKDEHTMHFFFLSDDNITM